MSASHGPLVSGMYRAIAAAWEAVTSVIGIEEVTVYTALGLIAWGSWQVWRPGAFLLPGAVMLWMYIPTRKPFLEREPRAVVVRRKVNE